MTTNQTAVLLYVDAALGSGPGDAEWDASLPHHGAFNAALQQAGLTYAGGALQGTDTATTLSSSGTTPGSTATNGRQLWGYYAVDAPVETVQPLAAQLWEAQHGLVELRPMHPQPGA